MNGLKKTALLAVGSMVLGGAMLGAVIAAPTVGALAPTWFDEVVQQGDDAKTIKKRLDKDKDGAFLKAIEKAVKFADQDMANRPKGAVGPSYGQMVRHYLIESLQNPQFMTKDFDPSKSELRSN